MANFVEGGGLEVTVAEISRNSARHAIEDLQYSKDSRSQAWSAINHLQQAIVSLRTSYERPGVRHLSVLRYGRLVREATLAHELLAVCYDYVDEEELRNRSLESAALTWGLYWEHRRLIGSTEDSKDGRSAVRALLLGMINFPTTLLEVPNIIRNNGEIDVEDPAELSAFLGLP